MSIKKISNWINKKNQEEGGQKGGHSDDKSQAQSSGHKTRYDKKFQPKNRPPKNRQAPNRGRTQAQQAPVKFTGPGNRMRIVPLGGLDEVGKNIMAVEYGNDIVVIDCGMSFAGPEMFGVDYIVPDVSYLEQRKRDVKAIVLTHGHLDHIGAIQYVLPRLGNPPIYATKLNCGLIKNRLREFGLEKQAKIHEFNRDTKLKFGTLEVEFFNVNHSIPEGMGVYVKSPAGTCVHTGDFKFDYSPAIDRPADFQRIAEIGRKGVDVLMIDSTNALRPGFCKSEAEIRDNLEDLVAKTKGRLIIASFSSLIGRVSQLVQIAAKYNRKVFLSGRSMIDNMALAEKLGYADFPKGAVRKIGPQANSLPPSQVMILTTGAQGEAMSALTRMAIGEHAQIKIGSTDTVVISASPIPGNELAVVNVINNLYAKGAKVITNGQMDVHTSGHAHQEELKLMYSLVKPKAYIPIHGELYMRIGHGDFIKSIADPKLHVTILENGDVLEISKQQGVRKSKMKVPANDILVDGLGFGDIGSRVIQDRKIMSQDGILILLFRAYEDTKRLIGEPDIVSRGFLYVKESQEVAEETRDVAKKAYEQAVASKRDWKLKELKEEINKPVSRFIRKRLGREPMILPIIMYT